MPWQASTTVDDLAHLTPFPEGLRPPRGGFDAAGLLAVLEGMDAAVVAVHTGDDAVLANSAARALFGLPTHRRVLVDELADHVLIEGLHNDAALTVDDLPLVRALSGAEVGVEVRVVPRDAEGASRPTTDGGRRLLLRARPLFGSGSEVVGAVCTAQDLTDLHTRHAALTRRARELAAVNEAIRAILQHEDARKAVCGSARKVTGATCVSLFEPDGDGDLVCTAQQGHPMRGQRVPLGGPSVVAGVFASRTTRVLQPGVAGGEAEIEDVDRLSRLSDTPLCAAIWQPVTSHGECLAVLALYFAAATPLADHLPVIELLAGETAMAVQRQELLRRLRLEASSDGLTGAANRRAWEEELPRSLAEARRTGAPLSLVMLDLDHFKNYNDAFGHPAGDALLRDTVAAWRQRLRSSDLLFRYGGEEFVVLLQGCGPAEAMVVAEQLRAVVPDGQTCSAGVGGWDRQEAPEELVQRVDEALYRAKDAGRDRALMTAPLASMQL